MGDNKVLAVINLLEPYTESQSITEYNLPVRECHRHLITRPDQFYYKKELEADLPVSSGEIKGTHRYIIPKRLKLAGAWWDRTNDQNMLASRFFLRTNGGWYDTGNRF